MYWANLMWLVRTHVLYCIYVCMYANTVKAMLGSSWSAQFAVSRLSSSLLYTSHSYIQTMYQCTFVYLFYVRIHMCIFLLCCFLNKCFTLNAETCFGQQRHMNSFILVNIAMWTVYKCVQMRLNATIDGAIVVRACYMSLSWKTNS